MKKYLLALLLALFCCTSKNKEGTEMTVYNGTSSDLFLVDKYTFDQLKFSEKVELFAEGFSHFDESKLRPYLKEEYVTMYTNKRIFFFRDDYENNRRYNSLVFYFIKREDLNKTKQQILIEKRYDSISIDYDNLYVFKIKCTNA